ncbi:MAG: hypothetical protein M3203_10645 [Actinomycetota bacterium]|nr:hypothetical protein [Actinomycetota bacterium]
MEEPQGRPDYYQGLGLQYWLRKWLPDPPPEAIDELILAQLYALASDFSDESLQARITGPIREAAQERLGLKS